MPCASARSHGAWPRAREALRSPTTEPPSSQWHRRDMAWPRRPRAVRRPITDPAKEEPMIWTAARNKDQGLLVTSMYERADRVPCEREAVMAGGLRGTDKASALTQACVDPSRYLT